jgi:hypothetical protein
MLTGSSFTGKIAIAVYVLCFTAAAIFHATDLLRWGWLPYDFAPAPMNWFWTLLTLADPLVVVLLVTGRRRTGLGLALMIMVFDVAANGYALFGLGYTEFAASLVPHSAFLGFILGSIAFLWRGRSSGTG